MKYWTRLLDETEKSLPQLLTEGGKWNNHGSRNFARLASEATAEIRSHQILCRNGRLLISLERLVQDNPKHQFSWSSGPLFGRVLEGSLNLGLHQKEQWWANAKSDFCQFGIAASGHFAVRRGWIATRSVTKPTFVLMIRPLSKKLNQIWAKNDLNPLTDDRVAFILKLARKYYPVQS